MKTLEKYTIEWPSTGFEAPADKISSVFSLCLELNAISAHDLQVRNLPRKVRMGGIKLKHPFVRR